MVASNRGSEIRRRRDVYEAVLRLETKGAVVIERQLGCVDVALSAAACLCLWTEASFQVPLSSF